MCDFGSPIISYQKELELITKNGLYIQYIQNPSDTLCKLAVNQNGLALKYINSQTDEICISAIKNDYRALKFANKQTFKMCMLAIYKSDGKNSIIKMIKNPEINIYCEILKKFPSEMQYVRLNEFGSLSKYNSNNINNNSSISNNNSDNVNKNIVDILGNNCSRISLLHKIESDEHLFSMCLQRNGLYIKYIKPTRLTQNLCISAVKNNGLAIKYIPQNFHTETLCLLALRQNVKAIKYINTNIRTTEMWTLALKKDGTLIKYLNINDFNKYNISSEKIREIIKILLHIAISQNKEAIMYTMASPICKLLVNLQTSIQESTIKPPISTTSLPLDTSSSLSSDNNLGVSDKNKILSQKILSVLPKEPVLQEIKSSFCEYVLITDKKTNPSTKKIIKDDENSVLFDLMIEKLLTLVMDESYVEACIKRLADNITIQEYIDKDFWGYHFIKLSDNKYSIVRVGNVSLETVTQGIRYDNPALWIENNGVININKKYLKNKVTTLYKFEVIV